ncbi:MAG: hypothetical protein H8Z69_03275 [Nanohaloarchaea archaeon]|nr:hypothetical protein [Candidatus Nanohaloarchaea archaeon]
MDLKELDRKQWLGILGVAAAVTGLLVVPPLLQKLYDISAITTTFVIIIIYFAASKYMQYRTEN